MSGTTIILPSPIGNGKHRRTKGIPISVMRHERLVRNEQLIVAFIIHTRSTHESSNLIAYITAQLRPEVEPHAGAICSTVAVVDDDGV